MGKTPSAPAWTLALAERVWKCVPLLKELFRRAGLVASVGAAQFVERLVRNEKARDSNPLTSSFSGAKPVGPRGK